MKINRILLVLLLITIIVALITGCSVNDTKDYQSMEDFAQARIGVMSGSAFNLLAEEYYPEATLSHMNMANLILNLKQKKIDGILMDMAFYTPLAWENESISYIETSMPATEYAVAFSKAAASEAYVAEINEFIRTRTENGWLKQQEEKWFSETEPSGSPDMSLLTGENGTLRVAVTVDSIPFDYLKNEQYSGFDADFIFNFAKEYGYALEIDLLSFDAIFPSLAAGRYDLAISGFTVTEERKESLLSVSSIRRADVYRDLQMRSI